jgi:ATP-binding cassette subfamily B multidrug efflux pump
VLILDDCFSAVDTETEEHILNGLTEHRREVTTLIVSNRISTVRHADQILFLSSGTVIESGTHAELIQLGGAYFELARQQNALAPPSVDDSAPDALRSETVEALDPAGGNP